MKRKISRAMRPYEEAFDRIIQKEGWDDVSWVFDLKEFDEPPLFTRSKDVEFLRPLPAIERGAFLLGFSLKILDRVMEAVRSRPDARNCFCCLTLTDWDVFASGEQSIVTPSVLLVPGAKEEMPEFWVRKADSAEGKAALSWLAHSGLSDILVADSAREEPSELKRIYVGREAKDAILLSLSSFLDESKGKA